jgi:hypothetical protein
MQLKLFAFDNWDMLTLPERGTRRSLSQKRRKAEQDADNSSTSS